MKKNTILIICILSSTFNTLFAKDILYKISDLPKDLKENARSVVRNEEMVFEINSENSATLKVKYAITVLNKNGLEDVEFAENYNKYSHISDIKGRVFDENGEQIKRIKSEDIIDHSAISGYSLYEDRRVKYIDPKTRTIPFTVEYSYEISYNSLYYFPTWVPYKDYNIAIEKSSFKVITPKGFQFRYLEKNLTNKVKISSDVKNDSYYWEVSNLKALIKEPYSYYSREYEPSVTTAANSFELDHYKCDLTSWQNFGNWGYSLEENRNNLPETTKKTIKQLIENANSDIDKIQKVYEYMQSKTRYVSIQIGIGGLQTIDAATVDRLSYGDCKALTNYMKSMLDVAGIKSYATWVSAGNNEPNIIKEFPYDYFSHVFLCIPLKNDTLWLECTNQRLPCGYTGDFTDDRDVLIIDKNASKLVHTKVYGINENQKTCTSQVKLDATGNGNAIITTNYRGLTYEEALATMHSNDVDKKRIISNRLDLPSFELQSSAFKENKAIIPSIEETLKLNLNNYATQQNSRLTFTLNFINRFRYIPERVRNRKTDVFIKRPSLEVDTVIYEFPDNLKVERLPLPVKVESQFGAYNAHSELKGTQLIYIRTLQINKGKFPPTAYADFIDFFEKINTADGIQCSLISPKLITGT